MTTPAPDPDLTYVRRSKCQFHLKALNVAAATVDAPDTVARVGQKRDCPDCGRTWQTVQKIAQGGVVQVEWVCFRPPGSADPDVAVDARIAALEQAVTSLAAAQATAAAAATSAAGTVADLTTKNTALTVRVTALEGRTVSPRLTRVPLAALTLGAGGKTDVAVAWSTAFPDANYQLDVALPLGLIGKVAWAVKTGTKTAAGVTVTLTATSALTLALGSDLAASAVRHA